MECMPLGTQFYVPTTIEVHENEAWKASFIADYC